MSIELIAVTRVIGAGLIPGNISGRLSYWPGELVRGGSRRKTKQRDRSEFAETIQRKEHPTTQVEKSNFVLAYC